MGGVNSDMKIKLKNESIYNRNNRFRLGLYINGRGG